MVFFFFFFLKKNVFESGVVSFIIHICSHVLSLLKCCRGIFEPHKSLIEEREFYGESYDVIDLIPKTRKSHWLLEDVFLTLREVQIKGGNPVIDSIDYLSHNRRQR